MHVTTGFTTIDAEICKVCKQAIDWPILQNIHLPREARQGSHVRTQASRLRLHHHMCMWIRDQITPS